MKHSKYILCGNWDDPYTHFVTYPLAWRADGKVTHSRKIPDVISAHKTDPQSAADGWVICVRKMSLDVPPPELPH